MKNYVALYPNQYEEEFNNEFLTSSNDNPLEDYIISAMKDFESVENIELLDYEVVYDQDQVDLNYHSININFCKKDMNSIEVPKLKPIYDNYFGEIIFHFKISTNLNEKIIEKRILLPLEIDGVYMNNGRKLKSIWQLVDASIYNQRNKTTLKSRMPIIVYHNKHRVIKDIMDVEHVTVSYSYASEPPKKSKYGSSKKKKTKFFNPLVLYSAKMGFRNTIRFFGMEGIVSISDRYSEMDTRDCYIFPVDKCYAIVDKELFDKYELVRSFVCMCSNMACRDFPITMDRLEEKEYFVCRIGFVGSQKNKDMMPFYDKGMTTIHMVERLLNETTIQNLRVPGIYKNNIYFLIYWIITNFDALRDRNNINMKNKRIRKNGYIVQASLGKKVSENINKLIERKSKSRMNTMNTLLELFNFGSDIVVSGMRNLNDLVKADDIVNDMTFLSDLAYSAKGPNSLGESSNKIISPKYRYLDPSMVGVLDIFTTSNSDCGLSGSFVPYVKIYDQFYFDPNPEPSNARYKFEKSLVENGHRENVIDVSTFEGYVQGIADRAEFDKYLKYEAIRIVEKPPTNTEAVIAN